jgi:site-specific DNA-methyltransferase (adenine-specific)
MEKLGNITLHNADCMNIIRELPDKAFDIAIVDPPYGIEELTGKELCNGRGWLGKRALNQGKSKVRSWDKSPSNEYFIELRRVSRNQIIWGGNYFDLPRCRCFVAWDKCQPWENFSQVEYAWTSFTSPAQLFKFDNRTGNKIHPTQKPVALYKWILQKYVKPGQTILDTHLGSGSSAIAAHDGGFEFTGIELDTHYYNAAKQRLIWHQKQLTIFNCQPS